MGELDPVLLARIQFAANISFHILFPSITIALGWFLLGIKLIARRRRCADWAALHLFLTKVFALCFALGVVSGVTMSFQFGTNWPGFMQTVGNIAGPLLAYEVLTAFFLEATFLGIMLFGQQRVPAWLHTLATAMVAIGTTLSAFWILVLDSWMQTPAGFEMREGVAHVTDWWAVIFNPSMPWRMMHMLLASVLTAAFLVIGLCAYRQLIGDRAESVRAGLRLGVAVAAIAAPLQIWVGDLHGLNTLEHQPAKIAAMEAIWHTERGAPLVLFGLPNEAEQRTDCAIEIPRGAALILTHELDGELRGLSDFAGEHPPVAWVFFSFRIMVGVGTLMLVFSAWMQWQIFKRRPLGRGALRIAVLMSFSGWVATLCGWYVTEVGRQPWLVTGVLRTADAAGAATAPMISFSLGLYLALYAVLLGAFIWTVFYLARRAAGQVEDAAPDFAQPLEVHP